MSIPIPEPEKVRDPSQENIINISLGMNLVLAPPGCGKTDILSERVMKALDNGVSPGDMACLTFTNRAARGMLSRIRANVRYDTSDIFVGNIHRFCSLFLFKNGFVPQNSSILAAEDVQLLLLDLAGMDESRADDLDNDFRGKLDHVVQISGYIYQRKHGHKTILHDCSGFFAEITPYAGCNEIALFDNIDRIYEEFRTDGAYSRDFMRKTNRIRLAARYSACKEKYQVMDFDDLLLKTCTILSDPAVPVHRFRWLQIDEVQDLNPLQLTICDLLLDRKAGSCVLYLGDEQQAIFSFMGASLNLLETIKQRCSGRLFRLENNYRSPSYLLDVYNTYANAELDTDPDFLPRPVNIENSRMNDLMIINCHNFEAEAEKAVMICKKILSLDPRHENDRQRTALVVPSNWQADSLAAVLDRHNMEYFKVSGQDAFASRTMQLILSHLSVFAYETNVIAWARVFRQLRLFSDRNQYARSRSFIKEMIDCMLTPADLIRYDRSSYLAEFSRVYSSGVTVLFDTETTGLRIHYDDIVQIAALRIQYGKVTGNFNILLKTDKEIPAMLGDIPNPLLAEYQSCGDRHERAEGLRLFLDFISSADALVAHNASYDYLILDHNLKRDAGIFDFTASHPVCFDTLKVARIIKPHLKSYKLKDLIAAFSLRGDNSHLADDDVAATKNLADYCIAGFEAVREKQEKFFENNRNVIGLFKAEYREPWLHTFNSLLKVNGVNDTESALGDEIRWLYDYFLEKGLCETCDKISHITTFINEKVLDPDAEPFMYQQISAHAMELNTFRETDLYDGGTLSEKIFITTVHKAKGLEFENVIVFDAVENVYPFYSSLPDPEQIREDARKFYVAISRAKIRLCILTVSLRRVYSTKNHRYYDFLGEPTRFLKSIASFFSRYG